MAEPKLVTARWVAPFEAEMSGVGTLVPGETEVEIPEPEAKASDNWKVVGRKRATKKRATKAKAKKAEAPVEAPADPPAEGADS